MSYRKLLFAILFLLTIDSYASVVTVSTHVHDMEFRDLARKWDEAIPLGNATIGSLIWQKGERLRMSIDRSDLWDLRHSKELEGEGFSFHWLYEQLQKGDYTPVQRRFDNPYNAYPGPSKIPGAGLEFPIEHFGEVEKVHLYQRQAVCEVVWKSGVSLRCFVHAQKPVGWFIFEGVEADFEPLLIPPSYNEEVRHTAEDHSQHSLFRLGYEQGKVERALSDKFVYNQPGWGDFSYSVAVKWKRFGEKIIGVWSVTSSLVKEEASQIVDEAMNAGIEAYYQTHQNWWNIFYSRSSVTLPDKVIEKQYYNEIYKMGSISRKDSYPISLQSVWTADNGQLPPWKGDYHHDLNTQLSYWPFYTGNYLEESYGYLHTLWNQLKENKRYTKTYFGTEGLNVPGVCTLLGQPMGGWCQYSLGPTISAWLSQHFYLYWKYSQDRQFLIDRCYPYLKEVATYLEQFTIVKDGIRSLPLSSSPEFKDNSMDAWFREMTNFDRALVRFAFRAAAELARELGRKDEADHWEKLEEELPDFILDAQGGLSIAVGHPYEHSHRHFSHLLAIHPLGLLDKSYGKSDSQIIDASLNTLDKYGPGGWTGYSYSWLANLKARAFDGNGAAKALRIFAECFCLRNGFHANGDQSRSGKSGFTYRPFTLEGNMAFASGVQEMLLQSHSGVIRVFPAIPSDWKDVSFDKLRAIGAFVVSASLENGDVSLVKVVSEKGGLLRLVNPFKGKFRIAGKKKKITEKNGVLELKTRAGEEITLERIGL